MANNTNSKSIYIHECLKQFNNFTSAINEVCNQASIFGRSLHSLHEIAMPEIVGADQVGKSSSRKFKNGAHLMDSLDSFEKIMMSYSERMKVEVMQSFENFIVQAVLPNSEEIEGVYEHNRIIIKDFRDVFLSFYNHFYILSAELLEKFLICDNCSAPVGFPHKQLCLTESLSVPKVWKKTKYDDKFITFGMKFSFDDIISPEYRRNIITQIASLCYKQQCFVQPQKQPMVSKIWLLPWTQKEKKTNKPMQMKKLYNIDQQANPMIMNSVWTPSSNDWQLLNQNFKNLNMFLIKMLDDQ